MTFWIIIAFIAGGLSGWVGSLKFNDHFTERRQRKAARRWRDATPWLTRELAETLRELEQS